MTKTITLPISKETCEKIGYYGGLTLWALATFGLLYLVTAMWFDMWNFYTVDRLTVGFFSGAGGVVSVIFWFVYLHDKGIWLSFQCKCEVDKL